MLPGAEGSGVEAEEQHVAVGDDIFLAFVTGAARFLGACLAADTSRSRRYAIVWARMKPRSKSEWMTPAACGALVPTVIVQARASFGPHREIGDQAEQRIAGPDETVEAGLFEAQRLEEFLLFLRSASCAISDSIAAEITTQPAPSRAAISSTRFE